MKSTALEVRGDGQICLIPDAPIDPRDMIPAEEFSPYVSSYAAPYLKQYENELTSTERILVSNQDVAQELLYNHIEENIDRLIRKRPSIKPGIYPIPDLQWEVKEELIGVASNVTPFGSVSEFRQVAILKESTPSHFNGCSPTACGCKSLADCPNNQPQITVIGQCFRFKKFSTMQEEPRSVASDHTELSSTDYIADVGKMVGKTDPSTEQESQEDWDTALTDAIVETEGRIQPYGKVLKYLKDRYTITKNHSMNKITFFIEGQKFETEKPEMTVSEILGLINLSVDRFTLARKVPSGYHEYSSNEIITLEDRSHFQPLDKRPTPNA